MPRFQVALRLSIWAVVFICNVSVFVCQAQETKLGALLQRTPAAPNAMSYLHIPSLKRVMADAGINLELKDQLTEVWLISDLDTATLRPNWEAGYAMIAKPYETEELAKSLGGYVDMVADKEVVWTPRQTYLVPSTDRSLGFLRPARRSLLVNWLSERGNVQPAPYLVSQTKQPEDYLSFMMSINLENVFSEVDAAYQLGSFESIDTSKAEAVGKVLASVKGLTIIVGRNSLKECIVSFEFGESPAEIVPVATQILNEILNRNGTAIPEILSWKASSDGNKLSLQGPIGGDTLDGVLGLFSIRGHAESVSESLNESNIPAGDPSESQVIEATKEYFGKVQDYIERARKYEAQTTGYRAKWNEQQARRIDELPTLYVDYDMMAYGADVANAFRNNATSIRDW